MIQTADFGHHQFEFVLLHCTSVTDQIFSYCIIVLGQWYNLCMIVCMVLLLGDLHNKYQDRKFPTWLHPLSAKNRIASLPQDQPPRLHRMSQNNIPVPSCVSVLCVIGVLWRFIKLFFRFMLGEQVFVWFVSRKKTWKSIVPICQLKPSECYSCTVYRLSHYVQDD